VIELHVLGASHEPLAGAHAVTAGEGAVQAPPAGPAHWHDEHPRESSAPV
jgi:hypothetical protein